MRKPSRPTPIKRLEVKNFAQIESADIDFGDLTILVGAQATGKSLLLQWLKLAMDSSEIVHALRESGSDTSSEKSLLDLVFGEGMSAAWSNESSVVFDGRPVAPASWTRPGRKRDGKVFFIPAHRALLLAGGWPAPFLSLNADNPVVARLFSQNLYQRFSGRAAAALFPVDRILKKQYRDLLDAAVFHGGRVDLDKEGLRYRLRLSYREAHLPFMTWTSGQREFTPLLLGLYHVLPQRKERKQPAVDWVVIEEPEMGLHPQAIAVVMLLALDLLWRGYRVAISTHSPLVLDIVWALQRIGENDGDPRQVCRAFGAQPSPGLLAVAERALRARYCVHYLEMDAATNRVRSRDISRLDPDAADKREAEWGGLTGFSSAFGEAVREAVVAREGWE